MSAKTLAELALKLWGVTLILGALVALPMTLWMAWEVPPDDAQAAFIRASQIAYVLNLVFQLLAGVVVLVWADRIVALFESGGTPLHINVSNEQLQLLAFAIVGVFVLVDGLQNAAAAGYVLLTKPDQVDTASYMWARQGEDMVKGVVEIAAGALLVLGRETLARGWRRLGGEPASGPADPDDEG